MDSIGKVVIDSQVYYSADDVKSKARVFAGSARNAREMVRQRKIPSNGYIYVRKQPGATTYKKTNGSASQDRVYFTEAFAKTIAELNPTVTREHVASSTPRVAKATSEEAIEQDKTPDIIELDDDEKFHDDEGNVLEIETRGERERDGIYFRVKDVAKAFGIESLKDVLLHKNKGYTRNVDYKVFACSPVTNGHCATTSTASARKYLFLTYTGLMRVLFVTRNNKTDQFQKWALETLFVAQMGSAIERSIVAQRIQHSSFTFSGLYLIKIASVSTVRHKMLFNDSVQDDDGVYKFGRAEQINARYQQHTKNPVYVDLGQTLEIICASFVPEQFLVEAEQSLRSKVYPSHGHAYSGKKELIVLNAKQLKQVVKLYESIKTNYSTMVSTTSQYIVDLRNELNETKLEVANKNIDIANKITEIANKNTEIANKNTDVATLTGQLEILKLQIENARLKADKAPKNKIKITT